MTKKILFLFLFLLGLLPVQIIARDLVSQTTPAHNIDHQYETMLINALKNIRENNIDNALTEIEHLIKVNPSFRLAQLIYGDLLLAQSRPITDFGNFSSLPYNTITSLREEARARWLHHLTPPDKNLIPDIMVKLSEDQEYAVTVDLSASRLYVFQNRKGVPHLINDFYISIGKNGVGKFVEGDQKTPIGVYFVTGFIDPSELPDFYGDGAFPIDYPNIWDQRHNRTGYGIWLHGAPSHTYSRPPRDSNGCVILSNQDLNTLSTYLQAGKTPVLLANQINWIAKDKWEKQQNSYTSLVEQWRNDWESLNVDNYLRHYAKDYAGLGKDYNSWVEYKRRVTPTKKFIRVNLSGTSIFTYPGENGLMVVTFDQDYRSDNYHRRFTKRQYWRKDDNGMWKIIYEGSIY